jgi:hypothetical protein
MSALLYPEGCELGLWAPTAATLAAFGGTPPTGLRLLGVVVYTPLGVTHSLCSATSAIGFNASTSDHSLPFPLGSHP